MMYFSKCIKNEPHKLINSYWQGDNFVSEIRLRQFRLKNSAYRSFAKDRQVYKKSNTRRFQVNAYGDFNDLPRRTVSITSFLIKSLEALLLLTFTINIHFFRTKRYYNWIRMLLFFMWIIVYQCIQIVENRLSNDR